MVSTSTSWNTSCSATRASSIFWSWMSMFTPTTRTARPSSLRKMRPALSTSAPRRRGGGCATNRGTAGHRWPARRQVGLRAGRVVGVHVGGPLRAVDIARGLLQAVDVDQLAAPEGALLAQVDVEDADVARVLRDLQALVRLAQRLFGALRFGQVFDDPDRGPLMPFHLHAPARDAHLQGLVGARYRVQSMRTGSSRASAERTCSRNSWRSGPPNRLSTLRPRSSCAEQRNICAKAGLNSASAPLLASRMGGALSKMAFC
jgi:hypothetical protein